MMSFLDTLEKISGLSSLYEGRRRTAQPAEQAEGPLVVTEQDPQESKDELPAKATGAPAAKRKWTRSLKAPAATAHQAGLCWINP